MKPCWNQRKRLAWLAMNALDAGQELRLRAHLDHCEGCRRYLLEISKLTATLAAANSRSDLQASESFHRKVVNRLRAEAPCSGWQTTLAHLRVTWFDQRMALPVMGAVLVLVTLVSFIARRPEAPLPAPSVPRTVLSANENRDLAPTVSNYQMVANQSLEKLDDLLTLQARRDPSPSEIYTASSRDLTQVMD